MNKNTKIVWKPIDDLIPYERNAKEHTETQINNLAKSFEQNGWQNIVLIDENNVIIYGHGRCLGAKKAGLTEAPCVVCTDLSEEEIKRFRHLDNLLSEGDYIQEAFDLDLPDLSDYDFSELELNINLLDIDLNIDEPKEIIEDDVPGVDEETEPICKLGDVWQLGEHKLICGDSTDPAVIDRLMDGVKADMVFTDPPYNMSDHLTGFANEKTKKALSTIVNFDPNTVIDTLFAINTNNYFIFTSKELIPKYFKIFEEWGFNILVWCKDNPTPMTNNTFLPDVEYLLYFYKNGRVWNNGLDVSVYKKYYNSNKMEGRKEAGNVHPTIKPIKIIADKIQICSNKNGIVVDLFGGSGSTLIACEQLNRKCYMAELDEKYCDVIIQRWENFTGEKAVLIDE